MRISTRLLLTLLFFALAASTTLSAALAHPPLPPHCTPANPETCLYTSDLSYPVGVVDGIVLRDPARSNYRIPLLIRYPIGAPGPRPVVIWHHGGNPSKNGKTRSEEWGTTLAAAGYIVIHPSRVLVPDAAPFQAECDANGFTRPIECRGWISEYRAGPLNTHFIIDRLDEIAAARPVLNGLFDPSKIVVGSHSAGSASVLAVAGAYQRWLDGGHRYRERDNRPIAFLASGPMGPLWAGFGGGFQSGSYAGIERPFLLISGVGDETGEPSESRVASWLTSVPGNKLQSWDTQLEAVHETMDIHKCDTPLQADHCHWIASLGLAFLDAVVRGRQEAHDWLASDAYASLTGGAIELHRR